MARALDTNRTEMSYSIKKGDKKSCSLFKGVYNQEEIDETHVYCIKSFLKTRKSREKLIKGRMFLIHMNVFDNESLIPSEIAVTYFTLLEGNSRSITFHAIFVADGHNGLCIDTSRRPVMNEINAMFSEMEKFILERSEVLKHVPLFARPDTVRTLQLIVKTHHVQLSDHIRIHDCAILIKLLQDKYRKEGGGRDLQEVRDLLMRGVPGSENKFFCNLHGDRDDSNECSMAIIDSLSSLACSICCPTLRITVKPGVHISARTTANFNTNTTEEENSMVNTNNECDVATKTTHIQSRTYSTVIKESMGNKKPSKRGPQLQSYTRCGDRKCILNGYVYRYYYNSSMESIKLFNFNRETGTDDRKAAVSISVNSQSSSTNPVDQIAAAVSSVQLLKRPIVKRRSDNAPINNGSGDSPGSYAGLPQQPQDCTPSTSAGSHTGVIPKRTKTPQPLPIPVTVPPIVKSVLVHPQNAGDSCNTVPSNQPAQHVQINNPQRDLTSDPNNDHLNSKTFREYKLFHESIENQFLFPTSEEGDAVTNLMSNREENRPRPPEPQEDDFSRPTGERKKEDPDEDLVTSVNIGHIEINFVSTQSRSFVWFQHSSSIILPFGTDFHRKLNDAYKSGALTVEKYDELCRAYNKECGFCNNKQQ